ncbi:hypothetical protein GCM10023170_015640 [Phytohabitans houttuyneae]|uniref:Uncharacterized protein n=1 Tax=Phytohabitans houttuyneae TaxID=1076126 RepID=A0A6V8KRF8_9ACTN|nr:hypothetical protein Phou_101900 [Phytohabitans houttuyneae]
MRADQPGSRRARPGRGEVRADRAVLRGMGGRPQTVRTTAARVAWAWRADPAAEAGGFGERSRAAGRSGARGSVRSAGDADGGMPLVRCRARRVSSGHARMRSMLRILFMASRAATLYDSASVG